MMRSGVKTNLMSAFAPICSEKRSAVAVVGGGMAGIWTAYQLAKTGIETTLVTYQREDRGGLQGASRRSAGAFNLGPLTTEGFSTYLRDLGLGQTHPSVARPLLEHLATAQEELAALMDLKPIKLGVALASGNGEQFLERMYRKFRELGGEIIDGWVTRLAVDAVSCQGLQYESPQGIGKLRARALVLASGGYAGLFRNSIRTNCFGNVLGSYLKCGGIATNLEFLFKHGYGNVDANALTPTEELPGAEIYDTRHERVTWLEQLLFYRQGTRTHLQAVQFWLRNPETEFYVDLAYRPLYLKLWTLNALLEKTEGFSASAEAEEAQAVTDIVELFPPEARAAVGGKIAEVARSRTSIGYFTFEELKQLFKPAEQSKFRVRPLTYFSMGGIAHADFATNLKETYVAGEAMHDFGANRVGGLPWSLYLTSAYSICAQISASLENGWEDGEDFDLDPRPSRFDGELLETIQRRMYESQEKELTAAKAMACIDWLRETRLALEEDETVLHDGVSWLLGAEAILECSLCRKESRGFFFRFDFQEQDAKLNDSLSCAWYDQRTDKVSARLLPWEQVAQRLKESVSEHATLNNGAVTA